jgi:N-acetylglucosaminyl-diphospho-decaprenol L-rhamnosyltransferase
MTIGDVDVIIPSYGTRDLTARAVQSALRAARVRRVIVVDNASPDDTVAHLDATFGASIDVLSLDTNRGFGAACNHGAEHATAPYLFFLNSDAVVAPDCLPLLVARLEGEPTIGIVAPSIRVAPGGPMQSDAQGRFPTSWSIILRKRDWQLDAKEPDWVSGVAFLARRQEFLSLGGFDSDFFMYYEDVDLCRRYRQAGYRVVRELTGEVVHQGGGSRRSRPSQRADSDRSQDLYLRRSGASWPSRLAVRMLRNVWRAMSGSRSSDLTGQSE